MWCKRRLSFVNCLKCDSLSLLFYKYFFLYIFSALSCSYLCVRGQCHCTDVTSLYSNSIFSSTMPDPTSFLEAFCEKGLGKVVAPPICLTFLLSQTQRKIWCLIIHLAFTGSLIWTSTEVNIHVDKDKQKKLPVY